MSKPFEVVAKHFKENAKLWITAGVVVAVLALFPLVLFLAGAMSAVHFKLGLKNVNLWTWIDAFGNYPKEHKKLWQYGFFSAALIYLLLPLGIYMGTRPKRALHGSARFANLTEIRKAKLMEPSKKDEIGSPGILVGKIGSSLLTFPGQQFVLLSAPTRGGKGVGIVIPNCLNYNQSMVVLDVKQENYNLTSGYRKNVLKQEVFLFNPFAEETDQDDKPVPRSHRYNPMSSISSGVFRVGDINSIGNSFWPTTGDAKVDFWNDNARSLFLGITLFLSELKERKDEMEKSGESVDEENALPDYPITFGEVLRQSSGRGTGKPLKNYLEDLLRMYGGDDGWLSGPCRDCLNEIIGMTDDVRASSISTFNGPLTIFRNPIVDCATSGNDFDLRDVRKKLMTIYLGITPDHLADCRRLINLIFSQLVNLNTKQLPQDNHDGPGGSSILKYACLLLMDEFTAIGKVEILAKAVSYIAGYNLRLMPIIQSVAQLESTYGKEDARTFVTNHAMQIIYTPREQADAQSYSEQLGYFTEKSASISRPKGFMGKGGGMSESVSDQRRALMLPQELKELDMWKEIILVESTKPIMCGKIKYFEDPIFKKRLLQAPPVKPMDIERFILKLKTVLRDFDPATDVDFEHQRLRPKEKIAMLEMYDQCPTPPDEDPLDEVVAFGFVQSIFNAMEIAEPNEVAAVTLDDVKNQAFVQFEDNLSTAQDVEADIRAMKEAGNSIEMSDEAIDEMFVDANKIEEDAFVSAA